MEEHKLIKSFSRVFLFSCYLDEKVFEAWDDLFCRLRELENVEKVIVAQSVHDQIGDNSADVLPGTGHWAGGVQQNDDVFGAGGRVDVPRTRSEVVKVRLIRHSIHRRPLNCWKKTEKKKKRYNAVFWKNFQKIHEITPVN